jgi:hypothetical protein
MVPRISDASKWVRGIGCEPDERGAEDKKGLGEVSAAYAEFMRNVSRALLPNLKLSVREGGERKEGEGAESREGRRRGNGLKLEEDVDIRIMGRPCLLLPTVPSTSRVRSRREGEREKNCRSTRGLREKGAADCDPRIFRL